ncbi:putative transcriptional regulatory protein [candidate division SR1 bacterium Aalborg_AAW-1]|nr:putative transcriptional regulatory protein [candidate division SR1 bacterium Aalborg_AAW-1]
MGRRHSIVNKKMGTAASKGKLYAKMSKIIEIQAKNGANPDLNPSLAQAVMKARQNGVPRDVIEKAIKKGSGQLGGAAYTEVFYEGYGPGGCAIYIKTLTDNTNRTSNAVRVTLQKYGGAIGEIGSVARQFEQKGIITISGKSRIEIVKGNETEFIDPYEQETLEMDAIEAGAEDIEFDDGICVITTSKNDYFAVSTALTHAGYKIIGSDIEAVCDNMKTLSEAEASQLETLLEHLEDDDDVQKVWTNIE